MAQEATKHGTYDLHIRVVAYNTWKNSVAGKIAAQRIVDGTIYVCVRVCAQVGVQVKSGMHGTASSSPSFPLLLLGSFYCCDTGIQK